jgi:hypothetical protein
MPLRACKVVASSRPRLGSIREWHKKIGYGVDKFSQSLAFNRPGPQAQAIQGPNGFVRQPAVASTQR